MKFLLIAFYSLIVFIYWGQSPKSDPHWKLLWEDNFDSLNPQRWKTQNNFDHYSGGVGGFGEPQVYIDNTENVQVRDGELVLTLRKKEYSCPQPAQSDWGCSRQYVYGKPYEYTSGWIESMNPYKVKFGYVEARIKAPYGNGFWPAFWLFSDEINTGSVYQEIDIFEMIPGRVEDCINIKTESFTHNYNNMSSNIHNGNSSNEPFCTTNFRVFSVDDYREWHTYGLEWSPSKIVFYVDDIPYRRSVNKGNLDPAIIIFNVALNQMVGNYDSKDFPAEMHVDFVKYYKLNHDETVIIDTCAYNFNEHTTTVKEKYILGGDDCEIIVPQRSRWIFRAEDEIILKGDFTVPLGSEIYFDVNQDY